MSEFARWGGTFGVGLFLVLGAVGCGQETHMQELYNHVLQTYTSSNPDRLYYVGSDNTYDYYYLKNEDKQYRVAQTESVREDRMGLTLDRSKWKVVSPTTSADGSSIDFKL
jgi:hypothetical protein